jgi:sugar phosphate isomerase/epimerase
MLLSQETQALTMYLTGIGDEAGVSLEAQIQAARELGWRTLELRAVEVAGFAKANLHDLPEAAFEVVVEKLAATGLGVCCFGSAIMNWAKTVETPFAVTLAEVERTIPRMQRLGTQFVRIMSLKPADDADRTPPAVFERVREVVGRFRAAGLQPVHENCMNHGGMSARHALELLEAAPGLRWVWDTGNPLFNPDRSLPQPWPRQDPWPFYQAVKPWISHVHVKDVIWDAVAGKETYTWPGEGHGAVRRVLADLIADGYAGGVSIEPHMAAVFHDAGAPTATAEAQRANFVEYGRRLARLVDGLRAELPGRRAG